MFLTRLRVEQVARRRWILTGPLAYSSALLQATITVPAEFVTDFASTPHTPLAWWIAGGRANAPAVIHDWLYQTQPAGLTRGEADAVLDEAMGADQIDPVGAITRGLIYWAVRAGGWVAWRRHAERKAKLNPIWTETGWPTDGVAFA